MRKRRYARIADDGEREDAGREPVLLRQGTSVGRMLASAAMPPEAPPDRLLAARVLREEAPRAGFTRVGIARAGEPPGFERFDAVDRRGAPRRHALPRGHARAAPIPRGAPRPARARSSASPRPTPPRPTSARTARGWPATRAGRTTTAPCASRRSRSWHGARRRLPGAWAARVCVDSTPIAERAFAAAAGLGWIGKNGCLIDAAQGSYLLLAEIVTDLDLPRRRAGRRAVRLLHALPRRLPDRRLRRAGHARRRTLHRLLDDRALRRRSRTRGRRPSATTSSAATSARRSVPGTHR